MRQIIKEGYFSASDIAKLYGVNIATVRKWMHEGLLKHQWIADYIYDLDREIYYGANCVRKEDLDDFDPIKSQWSLTVMTHRRDKKDAQDLADYLDQRYDELYSELCIIEQTREYLRSIEPWL